jgi:DNA-binding IscR family transcriptional regulator
MTHTLWTTLNKHMLNYLCSVSLADLVEQQKRPQPHHHHHDHKGNGKARRTIAVASV